MLQRNNWIGLYCGRSPSSIGFCYTITILYPLLLATKYVYVCYNVTIGVICVAKQQRYGNFGRALYCGRGVLFGGGCFCHKMASI
jgi:hypothetical protein